MQAAGIIGLSRFRSDFCRSFNERKN